MFLHRVRRVQALDQLWRHYGTTVVLCTATQPACMPCSTGSRRARSFRIPRSLRRARPGHSFECHAASVNPGRRSRTGSRRSRRRLRSSTSARIAAPCTRCSPLARCTSRPGSARRIAGHSLPNCGAGLMRESSYMSSARRSLKRAWSRAPPGGFATRRRAACRGTAGERFLQIHYRDEFGRIRWGVDNHSTTSRTLRPRAECLPHAWP